MTKAGKSVLADRGAFVLMRLPASGPLLDQDAKTMNMLSFITEVLHDLRSGK